MPHPLERLSRTGFRRVYWISLLATAGMGALLTVTGAAFSAKEGPDGTTYDVISFELMRTPENAQAILSVWAPDGIEAAILQTKLDFIFLFCYSTLIAAGIVALYPGAGRFWVTTGRALAWGQWLGGLADAFENAALLKVLSGAPESPWPQFAFAFAVFKFSMIGLGLLWLLAALPLAFQRKA